jgi:hypothetical protein
MPAMIVCRRGIGGIAPQRVVARHLLRAAVFKYGVALATLDDDLGVRPGFHIFVGSKAPWFEITDGLPQYQDYPPPR